jgi:hypothetical protein
MMDPGKAMPGEIGVGTLGHAAPAEIHQLQRGIELVDFL